jgi:hypothetical protein
MLTKLIASAVASVAVFASGALVANSHTAPPKAAEVGSCCFPGSDCCFPGSPCCFETTDCCAAGLPCCETGDACCATKTVTKADTATKVAKKGCCTGGECCFPTQGCCAAK